MSVTFDASGFTANSGASPSTSTPITVGSGSNRALVVYVGQRTGALGTISVTWNGTSMSSLGTDAANGQIFGLVNPASGANNLVVTFSGGGTVSIGALSVTGADQTGGSTTFHGFTTVSGAMDPTAVTVSSANGEIAFAGFITSGTPFASPTAGSSDVGHDNTGTNPEASCYITSTGATAMPSYNTTIPSGFSIASGISILAAAGSGVTYSQLERGIRGLHRGVAGGSYH